jgi:hypothetical protein
LAKILVERALILKKVVAGARKWRPPLVENFDVSHATLLATATNYEIGGWRRL